MKYPLIKKWLGLEIEKFYTPEGPICFIDPDELEDKLAKGFEVYEPDEVKIWGSNGPVEEPEFVALAIGKQPIKKKTKEEAALEWLERFADDNRRWENPEQALEEAKAILEMK